MNYPSEAIGLDEVVLLMMDLENEAIIDPAESEESIAFKRSVLKILRKHSFTAADLEKSVVGDGVWTILTVLRGNPRIPWNVLIVLRDWNVRYETTGYDYVAAWAEQQDFQGC